MYEYWKNDYAKNKISEGIVYRSVTGETTIIKLEDFLRENPEQSEADFLNIKKYSDDNYHQTAKGDRREESHQAVIYEEMGDNRITEESPEYRLITRETSKEMIHTIMDVIEQELTEIQKKRLLYSMNGLTTRQIAKIEGVDQKAIVKSLQGARKKITNKL